MKFNVSSSLSIRKIGDEIFIFDRKLSKIHTFNKVGSLIWERLSEKADAKGVIDKIIDRFEVKRETAEKDLREFIDELEIKGLVTINNIPSHNE